MTEQELREVKEQLGIDEYMLFIVDDPKEKEVRGGWEFNMPYIVFPAEFLQGMDRDQAAFRLGYVVARRVLGHFRHPDADKEGRILRQEVLEADDFAANLLVLKGFDPVEGIEFLRGAVMSDAAYQEYVIAYAAIYDDALPYPPANERIKRIRAMYGRR